MTEIQSPIETHGLGWKNRLLLALAILAAASILTFMWWQSEKVERVSLGEQSFITAEQVRLIQLAGLQLYQSLLEVLQGTTPPDVQASLPCGVNFCTTSQVLVAG